MIVLCSSCAKAGLPSFQREKEPYGDTRISHGLCPTHEAEWRAQAEALHDRRAAAKVPA